MKEIILKDYLRENNLKYTKTRQVIYDYLKSTFSHPSAEEVFEEVRKKLPGISNATVYNVLNLFADRGLIKVLSTLEDKKRFDGNTNPHVHLICLECGKIEDLPVDDSALTRNLAETNWSFKDLSLNLFGFCPACLKKGSRRKSH